MTQKLATYAPAEARALENILIKGMKHDPAATGGKAPGTKVRSISQVTPARAKARERMAILLDILDNSEEPLTRADILERLHERLPEKVKPQLVSNWLVTLREEGEVACTYGKINYWRAI